MKLFDNPDEMKGIREKTRTIRLIDSSNFIERPEGKLAKLLS